MITEIQIDRSRILKGVRVPVRERFSVVVGPNGSGKTTLLNAIVAAAGEYKPSVKNFHGFVTYRNSNGSKSFPKGLYSIGWESDDSTGLRSIPEDLSGLNASALRSRLKARFIRLSAESAAQVSYNESPTPVFGDRGENLASILSWHLKAGQTEVVQAITASLQLLVPQIQRIWVSNAKLERDETEIITAGGTQYPVTRKKSYWGDLLMFDTNAKKGIPASEMSEGTLLATALLTLLHGENPPNLLLLDDIDKGLHPRAINSLVEILRGLMEQRPELQIIATTHSPYLLDQIPVEAVICMHVGEDGFAKAKLLSDHPEYENWKDTMTAGEFWSVMGEAWVTQPVKAATT